MAAKNSRFLTGLSPVQQESSRRRTQITVACNECRSRKRKCDGSRPKCQQCVSRMSTCVFSADADAPPIIALKRKHEALQLQTSDEHEILSRLRSVSRFDAHRILGLLRDGEDIEVALQFARDLPTPDTAAEHLVTAVRKDNLSTGSLSSVPYGGYSSEASVALDPNSVRHRPDIVLDSRKSDADLLPTTRLPSFGSLFASVEDGSDTSFQSRTHATVSNRSFYNRPRDPRTIRNPKSAPQWHHDTRLNAARGSDWGVSYVDDDEFRSILVSYLTWDHPSWHLFDEDQFLDGLVNLPSESCSRCLVNAIMAYGAKNYAYINPDTAAIAGHFGMIETQRLLDLDNHGDGTIAVAAAGILFWTLHSTQGTDKIALPYLLQSRHIALDIGLYQKGAASRVYDAGFPQRTHGRAISAWGFFSYLAFVELAYRSNLSLPEPPPVKVPTMKQESQEDLWIPWPWPLASPISPALTNEIFAARAVLFTIANEISPLQQRHSNIDLSYSYLETSVKIYGRLRNWWDTINPALKILDHATPQLLLLHCSYHYAIIELFRPFTTCPASLLYRTTPLRNARLPDEPALPASRTAAENLRNLIQHFVTAYPDIQIPCMFAQFALSIAFQSLPSASALSLSFSTSAAEGFLVALRLLQRAGSSFPVVRFALLSIEQAALKMKIPLPGDAEEILADTRRDIVVSNDRDRVKAGWVVDLSTAGTDLQAARLDSLIKELDRFGIGGA